MKLRLYSSATKNFNNNGLGSLNDAFNATVKEEANGELTLTFSYPVNGKRFSDLINDNIVVAKPNATDADHAFRIVNAVPDFSGMYNTVIAVSITNDIAGVPVANFSRVDKGKDIANAINTSYTFPTGLSLASDITTSGKVENSFTNLLALIAGSENSLLTAVGGELKRTNQGLQLLTRRGRDYPVKFSLHKNINGIKITTDTSSVITGILPYVTYSDSDQKEVVIIGDVIKAGNASDYAVQKIQPTAIPSRRSTDTTSSTDQSLPIVENKTQLMTAATAYYKGTSFVNSSYPTVTVEIDVASVQNSTEYKQFTNITDIGLFDTVKVDLSEYGLSYDMKVSDIQYDPIEERVVSVTLGKNKKTFTSSISSQIAQNKQSIDNVTTIVTNTATTIDGKNSVTWGNVRPSNPLEGDTWFQRDGDYNATWVYGNGQWNQVTDSDTQAKIKEGVELAIETANQNTDTAIEQNNASQQEVMNDIAKSQADLAIKDGDFNNKAQAMADKALSDAKANTATVAQETLNTANQNLATAKGELTDGLQKEVSDRTSAVSALDTKAQGYVSAAKTDVLETVNKEVTDRQNAVSALDTKAQDYANVAKTDALNALTEEVTNRQNAVSALDTKATNAVNQAKSDINDTINALSVGGRNYLLNSNGSTLDKWTPVNGWSIISDADRGNVFTFTPTTSWTGGSTNSLSQTRTNFPTDKTVTVSFWAKASVDGAKFHSEPTGGNAAANSVLNVSLKTNWQRYSYTFYLSSARIYFMPVDSGVTYWVDDLQLEIGNMISDYSQAPEDIVYDYTDKDNQIKQTFTQYQQSNDGKVSKAQTDVATALGQVATKVSQTDYNAKTGQLQTDLTTTTQTANQAKTDIVSIKQTNTSQDSRMNTIESDASGTKQTVSQLQTAQGQQSGSISTLQQRADGFDATVTKVNNLSVGGRNYVQNSSGLNGSSTVKPTLIGAMSGASVNVTYQSDGILMTNGATNTTTEWYYQVANAWSNFSDTPLTPGKQITFSADVMGTVPQAVLRYGFTGGSDRKELFKSFDINNTGWTRVSITVTSTSTNTGLYFRIQGGNNNQYANGWSGG
ncbi:MAG: phage tail spike protein, partial [Leuconostoc mesenteroides]